VYPSRRCLGGTNLGSVRILLCWTGTPPPTAARRPSLRRCRTLSRRPFSPHPCAGDGTGDTRLQASGRSAGLPSASLRYAVHPRSIVAKRQACVGLSSVSTRSPHQASTAARELSRWAPGTRVALAVMSAASCLTALALTPRIHLPCCRTSTSAVLRRICGCCALLHAGWITQGSSEGVIASTDDS
jgi:hypothetical protein